MRRPRGSGVMVFALWLVMSRPSVATPSLWRCRAQPVEPSFTHHGRLSSQNGIARKIWLIGTPRVVSVDNDEGDIPSLVARYLEMTSSDHSYIYGEFNICPLAPVKPGHMGSVCVSGAEKLVVLNLRRSRPPFRLLSTWPQESVNKTDREVSGRQCRQQASSARSF
jgi:hypothetical protein